MTTLMEDVKEVIHRLWRSMGFEASAGTAAAVLPAVVLGLALNAIALNAVDSVRPIKVKEQIVCLALVKLQSVQMKVFSTFRQIEDSGRNSCRRVEWQRCA